MFHQAVEFVQRLEWPNSIQECRFNTALSKVIGVALEQYTTVLEDMIHADVFPHSHRAADAHANGNVIDRARTQFFGNRGTSTKAIDDNYDFLAEVSQEQTCQDFLYLRFFLRPALKLIISKLRVQSWIVCIRIWMWMTLLKK